MYNIILLLRMKENPHINLCTLIRTINTYSLYEILVHTLTKFRGRKRERKLYIKVRVNYIIRA
jgi:hypothetical protein